MTTTYTTLTLEDMAAVNGGTFTPNKFPKWAYQRAGFFCDYNFFSRDEFFLNGKKYYHDQANMLMEQMGFTVHDEFEVETKDDIPFKVQHVYYNGVEIFE